MESLTETLGRHERVRHDDEGTAGTVGDRGRRERRGGATASRTANCCFLLGLELRRAGRQAVRLKECRSLLALVCEVNGGVSVC